MFIALLFYDNVLSYLEHCDTAFIGSLHCDLCFLVYYIMILCFMVSLHYDTVFVSYGIFRLYITAATRLCVALCRQGYILCGRWISFTGIYIRFKHRENMLTVVNLRLILIPRLGKTCI